MIHESYNKPELNPETDGHNDGLDTMEYFNDHFRDNTVSDCRLCGLCESKNQTEGICNLEGNGFLVKLYSSGCEEHTDEKHMTRYEEHNKNFGSFAHFNAAVNTMSGGGVDLRLVSVEESWKQYTGILSRKHFCERIAEMESENLECNRAKVAEAIYENASVIIENTRKFMDKITGRI